jgi:RNA-directed DNA polymerase
VTTLRYAAEVPIRRHIKIKAEANPFDPAWEGYFEDRQGFKMFNSLKGRKKLIRLWLAQQGICCVCEQRITKDTGWHVHHIGFVRMGLLQRWCGLCKSATS